MKVGILDWLKGTAAVLVLFGSAIAYIHANFASAADVNRVYEEVNNIEVRLIKQDIREIRRELKLNHLDPDIKIFLEEQLFDAIIELCNIRPEDKECR